MPNESTKEQTGMVHCCICDEPTKVIKPYPEDEQLCDDCLKDIQQQRD